MRWVLIVMELLTQEGDRSLYKADIDSAFRRVPIQLDHRTFAKIILICATIAMVAEHGIASVQTGIARVKHSVPDCFSSSHSCRVRITVVRDCASSIHLPILKFVDDFFSADQAEAAEHAM